MREIQIIKSNSQSINQKKQNQKKNCIQEIIAEKLQVWRRESKSAPRTLSRCPVERHQDALWERSIIEKMEIFNRRAARHRQGNPYKTVSAFPSPDTLQVKTQQKGTFKEQQARKKSTTKSYSVVWELKSSQPNTGWGRVPAPDLPYPKCLFCKLKENLIILKDHYIFDLKME